MSGIGGRFMVLLAAASAILAQSGDAPVKSPGAPDVLTIMESSIAATQRHWQTRLRYTWVERDENRKRDPAGRVKSEEVDVTRTILVNGVPFEQLLERNGRPPEPWEARKQKEKLDALNRETPEQRARRTHEQEEDNASIIREVPRAFDFELVGEDLVKGRTAWILQATPRPGYQAQGKYGAMFSRVAGRLWVDKQDFGWIKVDGQVTQPFSIGLFLARVLPGSRIMMEQTRVDDGIWMPERVEVRAAAKIFFIKSLVIEHVLSYSEYKRP